MLYKLRTMLDTVSHISAKELVKQLGLKDERELRDLMHEARLKGMMVCSGNNGYYMAKSIEDFRLFERREQASIDSRQKPLDAMRKTAEELWGKQNTLPF
jgi:hypothetical protein